AESRFPEVPVVVGDRFVVTPHRIYEVDFRRGALDLRFELPGDEVFTVPFVSADTFVVAISDRRFFLFEPRELARPTVQLEPIAAVELPGERRNVDRILVAELVDGYLATFVFGSWASRGFLPSEQVVVEVGIDGSSRVAALRPLEPGMPDIYRHRGFWLSPFFQTAHDLVWAAIGPHRESRVTWADTVAHPPPARMIAVALLVALASAAAIALLAWRRGLGRGPSLVWAAGGLLLGLPALLAFLSLTARDEAIGLPEPTPAPRSAALPHLLGREGWNV
ncbi:MAG: hypothetical protein MI919_22310, partial [Holophagales bacterium]|nr:hypothetical protein [Holophagales bacterium]